MERFQRFLDAEEQRQEQDDPQAVFEAVWSRARGALFVNAGSTGRDTLDAVITALWNGEDPTGAWMGPVNLMPPLAQQREVAMVDDGEFSLSGKRPAEVSPSGSAEPASKRAKGKPKSSSKSDKSPATPKAAAAKDPATTADKESAAETKPKAAKAPQKTASSDELTMLTSDTDLPTMGFELADGVPQQIRKDLFRVFHRAATKDRPPFRLAYPWVGVRLWYDPEKYPNIHLLHWRFWNGHRRAFWQCAVHPPLPAGNRQNYYRKQKMNACRARLQFLSCCIEAWGYVAFLKLLDAGNTQLLWLGGRPGRHSPNGTKENSGVDQDLAVLYAQDPDRYRRRLKAALDPKKIDEDGFASVTELLEQTSALDPDKEANSRLSDRALARVCSDLIAEKPFQAAWVPDSMKPVFKKLRNHPRILAITISDELHEPKVRPFKPKESKLPGFSPFRRADKSYTALAPLKGGVVTFPPAANNTAVVVPVPQGSPTVSNKDLFGEDDADSDDAKSDASDDEVVAEDGEVASGAEEDSDEEESDPQPSTSTKAQRAPRTPKTRSHSKSK